MESGFNRPGIYSLFVLRDDGTWCQPIYYVPHRFNDTWLECYAMNDRGGFYATGVMADPDAPDHSVAVIG